jgi:hypothetical protein
LNNDGQKYIDTLLPPVKLPPELPGEPTDPDIYDPPEPNLGNPPEPKK